MIVADGLGEVEHAPQFRRIHMQGLPSCESGFLWSVCLAARVDFRLTPELQL